MSWQTSCDQSSLLARQEGAPRATKDAMDRRVQSNGQTAPMAHTKEMPRALSLVEMQLA